MLSDAEWILRGVALVEAALKPEPLLSPRGNFFALISDLNGEPALSLIVAVLGVVGRIGEHVDCRDITVALGALRADAIHALAEQ